MESLSRVYNYATNSTKTEINFIDDPYDELNKVLNYASDGNKTEHQYFVSGIQCSIDIGIEEMNIVKQLFHKEGGILAYHGYQSFKPGEVTPEVAHEIGVKLAQELWGDRFQLTISTHLDKGHLHNHFVINSVSFVDGKRFYNNKKSYTRMRKVSDRLCREYKLNVIENPKYQKKQYAEWKAIQEKQPTIRGLIRKDVEEALSQSLTYTQFIKQLKSMGYEIKDKAKYVAIKGKEQERYIRLKSLGSEYTETRLKERILENKPFHRKHVLSENHKPLRGDLKVCKKITGVKALYFHYLYALGTIPKKSKAQKPLHYLKADILKLEKITEEIRFLNKHDLTTVEDVTNRKDKQVERLSFCLSSRRRIYNLKRKNTASDMDKDLIELNKEIYQLRKEVVICKRILLRTRNIKHNLKAIKQEKNKESEVKKHEPRSSRSGS